jgi:hypothetical protein
MKLFGKSADAITSKIIFHASTLGIPERQQLGKASLSSKGFKLHIAKTAKYDEFSLHIPLDHISNLRTFQKKTYSSVFYVIQIDFRNENDRPAMVSCEIRVFFRRGQALLTVKEWKRLYKKLTT